MNPGSVACWGYIIYDGNTVIRDHGVLGAVMFNQYTTNNLAEYTGLIKAMEHLLSMNVLRDVHIFGDSLLVVNQMNNVYQVNSPRIIPLYEKAKSLEKKFSNIEIRWIPREQNAVADEQTNIAYKEFLKRTRTSSYLITNAISGQKNSVIY